MSAVVIPLFTIFAQRRAESKAAVDRRALAADIWREICGAGLPQSTITFLQALLKCAHDDGYAGPTVERIARMCGVRPRTATRYLSEIRGQTCGALGIDARPVRTLSGWLHDYIEHGKPMWRVSAGKPEDYRSS